ncbi:MAG: GIY-YIG nuclease family protein [Clostridia bacterium]|nr:GIY-YIG nuclease family protein [Clostridia bacterium]
MNFGKVIKLFLLDGSPNKRWICELSNWTGLAYKIPRNMVKESESRNELSTPGIYFLFGYDDLKERPLIYVGEAENIIKRLKEHLAKKDNWNEVILFISKDDNLNKAHIKYLEHEFYHIAKKSNRYSIDNSNVPTKSTVSEADQAELEEFIYNAKILVNALGHKVFETVSEGIEQKQVISNRFQLSVGDGKAYCIQTSDGFVLLKGSVIHKEAAGSLNIGIKKKVEQCRENGEIVNNVLQIDKVFTSSSSAAAFAASYSISGPQSWKTKSGKTLKSIETKKQTE